MASLSLLAALCATSQSLKMNLRRWFGNLLVTQVSLKLKKPLVLRNYPARCKTNLSLCFRALLHLLHHLEVTCLLLRSLMPPPQKI